MTRIFLFLYLLISFPFLTSAQGEMLQRGCRRGVKSAMMQRRSGTQKVQIGGDFYHGERHQLTVLVAFNDRTFVGDETETVEQWNKIFNVANYKEDNFTGSVHDYFRDQSLGQLKLTFDLQYVALSDNHAKYGSTSADDENSQFLVQDIMDVLQTRDIDWSQYDWNDDGYVNQLLIVYAGKGSSYGGFGGGRDAIWPHQYWLTWHVDSNTGKNCEPISVTYGEKQYLINSYCAVCELASDNTYGSFGTVCHEFSHCFGFPDFYNDSMSFLGAWELMDRGNYNANGFQPCGYSAHERWLMGWLTPKELTEAETVTQMPSLSDGSLQDAPLVYLIRNEGHPSEFYLLENRQQTGWDSNLPGSGLVVFHIDYDDNVWTTDYPNTSERQRYSIIPANNRSVWVYNSGWAYPYGTNNQLTNDSNPAATLFYANTDGTKLMSKPLTNISVTDGLASFNFTNDMDTGVRETLVSRKSEVLYQLGPFSIIRCENGEVKKVVRR